MPSADVGHVTKKGCLHAAGAQLVHPEGRLMLQRCAAWVEREVYTVVEQAAERGHVEVRETHETSGEVGGVVEGAEDASKLSVEQGLRDAPRGETWCRSVSQHAQKTSDRLLAMAAPRSPPRPPNPLEFESSSSAPRAALCPSGPRTPGSTPLCTPSPSLPKETAALNFIPATARVLASQSDFRKTFSEKAV